MDSTLYSTCSIIIVYYSRNSRYNKSHGLYRLESTVLCGRKYVGDFVLKMRFTVESVVQSSVQVLNCPMIFSTVDVVSFH